MITRRNLIDCVQNLHKSQILQFNSLTVRLSIDDLRRRLREKHLHQSNTVASSSRQTLSENDFSTEVEDWKLNFTNENENSDKPLNRIPVRQFLRKQDSKKKKKYEEVFEMKFGTVRLDSMNDQKATNIGTIQSLGAEKENKSNTFDEQYFSSEVIENAEKLQSSFKLEKSEPKEKSSNQGKPKKEETNFFDAEYFEGVSSVGEEYTPNNDNFVTEGTINVEYSEKEKPEIVIIKEHFPRMKHVDDTREFGNSFKKKKKDITQANEKFENVFDSQYFEGAVTKESLDQEKSEEFVLRVREDEQQNKDIYIESDTRQRLRTKDRPKANIETPKTAYDLAMKLRLDEKLSQKNYSSEKKAGAVGRFDSKGFRILTDQVPPFHKMSDDVVLSILKDSILYEDDELLVIDKPYGLASHGGPGIKRSVGQFLNRLCEVLNCEKLYVGHRLDKETTGVMVLAKNELTLGKLQLLFKQQKIKKKYLALTKGVPDPLSGIVDIPIGEHMVDGRYRMGVLPDYSEETNSFLNQGRKPLKSEAITQYRVLSQNSSVGLVLLIPKTGVKHQLRCHLAFALNTPVLGDHKYSHSDRFAPQKLYPETLQRLHIRQAKVRHLAMHLHAHTIVLPEWRDGKNLFFIAKLPPHFTKNMKNLKISYNFFKDRI
ncbi:DgyrCDS9057 [Dimorphilus gyrociliatus]|uniref:Pseudouridylate synthase RPUSD4, mitochondrial n=1 Tax=Dimorphilus gyrociliatus TaxID=2664684 RepID=A0A7I8VVZ0_9ANNE|nr:DgyrCDS9057 [Dimorphilus gyrociliatus]